MTRILSLTFFSAAIFILFSCGEDRSGEQPFAPTLTFVGITVEGDSARLTGEVLSSVNSSLVECGFLYGNDTLRAVAKAPFPVTVFTAVTDSLGAGTYYAVPYAKNRVGTTYADTVTFVMPSSDY